MTIKKNIQLDESTNIWFDKQFDGKGAAAMRDILDGIAFLIPNHPIINKSATFTDAIEYIILTSKAMYQRSMVALKGMFSKGELSLIIDVMNGTMLSPAMPGESLRGNVPDGIALDWLDEKWGIDGQALVEKIKNLGLAECSTLELWANGFWYGENAGENIEKYLEQLI